MASSLLASQTLILQNPTLLSPQSLRNLCSLSAPNNHHRQHLLGDLSKPRVISFRPTAVTSFSLFLRNPRRSTVLASSSTAAHDVSQSPAPTDSLLTGSTRTITTLGAIILAASQLLVHRIVNLGLQFNVPQSFVNSAGPAFFAAMKYEPIGRPNTPLTVVAAGMAKWLKIYNAVLMVRVLLSWFPNIPWDRQPLSAIRDLCDPYLNLFRNIIPPIFNALDISPLFAFFLLGVFASILTKSTF